MLALLAPVLRTLTESTADNSIAPLSGVCLLVNLALADHSSTTTPTTGKDQTGLKATLSLNAAVAGSTILASRLQDNVEAFALLFLATGVFTLLPLLKQAVKVRRHPVTNLFHDVGLTESKVDLVSSLLHMFCLCPGVTRRTCCGSVLPMSPARSRHRRATRLAARYCSQKVGELDWSFMFFGR